MFTLRGRFLAGLVRRCAREVKGAVPFRLVEGHVLTDRRRGHTRQRLDPLDQLPIKIRLTFSSES